jgi:hypothetical protein
MASQPEDSILHHLRLHISVNVIWGKTSAKLVGMWFHGTGIEMPVFILYQQ